MKKLIRRILKEETEEKLIDLTGLLGAIKPDELDDIFLEMNEKKGNKYYGYQLSGKINFKESKIKEFKYLVKINGYLNLSHTKIKSLGNLEYVGGSLNLRNTPIESLGNLKSVGRNLYLEDTPLSKRMTKEEIRNKVDVNGNIYL